MYTRRIVNDYETVMNKDLYDNLQDGIDELKQAELEVRQDLSETKQSTAESLAELGQDFSAFKESVEQGLDNLAEGFQELEDNVTEIATEGGGIKFDAERDMIVVKNPYKDEWVDYQSTGKIILPSTITMTTTSLIGQAVTCTIGDESYTTTFVPSEDGETGIAVFKVYSDGTATITCGEFSTTVEVQQNGGEIKAAELEEFHEIVLYENGTAMNGAGVSSGLVLQYSCNKEALFNRSVCFEFTTNSPVGRPNIHGCYLTPDGVLYTDPGLYVSYSFEIDTPYIYSLEQDLNYDRNSEGATWSFWIACHHTYGSSASNLALTSWLKKFSIV